MTVRKQLEEQVLQRMAEAKGYLNAMRDERLDADHSRFAEWACGVELLIWFAFGELSAHHRTWQAVLTAEATQHVLYSRLSGCLHRAQKALINGGLPNPLLPVPERLVLPAFFENRSFGRAQRAEQARWELFFTGIWTEQGKL